MNHIEDQYFIDDSGFGHTKEKSSQKPTVLLYMTHEDDLVQQERVELLREAFDDNFYLVWDNKSQVPHLFGDVKTITDQPVTKTRKYSHQCCAQEKAIMWLVENSRLYKHAWLVENDVYFQSAQTVKCFFEKYENCEADLIHQNQSFKPYDDPTHWHFNYLVNEKLQPQARFKPPFFKGMFNLFRMSSRMVLLMNHWREKNSDQWIFFEPLIATLAGQSNYLETLSFDLDKPSVKMRHKPVFTSPEAEILHPVKGNFRKPFRVDLAELKSEITAIIPLEAKLLFVDGDEFGIKTLPEHRSIPFTGRNKRYWGPPGNSSKAISELEDRRADGTEYIVICQPAFWWLRYYSDFAEHLDMKYKCLAKTKNVVVYDLISEN